MNFVKAHAGTLRPSLVHASAHAALGPDGQLARLPPMLFALLSVLDRLPPDDVARYDVVAAQLWPGGVYLTNVNNTIHWHAGNLNRILTQIGYQPRAIRVVDRVGLTFNPRPHE